MEVGIPQGWPEYVLHQMVTVMRGGEEVKLSKRAGSYFTLRDLIEEAGRDATRWFLIARKPDSQLTFDIDLARQQSNDNPVFYVQYAHARVCSLLRQAQEKGLVYEQGHGLANLGHLADDASLLLMNEISRYPEVVEAAGVALEPHLVAQYLRELAHAFHTWYHGTPVLVEDAADRNAKLTLACAARQVLANGLELLGVSAPEKCKHQETQYTWQHDAAKPRHDATAAARAHPDGCGWWPCGDRRRGVPGGAEPVQGRRRRLPARRTRTRSRPRLLMRQRCRQPASRAAGTPKPAEPEKPAATVRLLPLLPGKEVEMSDAELAASARAEDQRRAKAEASRAQAALEGKPVPATATTGDRNGQRRQHRTGDREQPSAAGTAERAPGRGNAASTAPASTSTAAAPRRARSRATAPATTAAPAPADNARYILQAGAFGASGDAEATKAKLAMMGLAARVESAQINGKTVYRVRMGPYGSARTV